MSERLSMSLVMFWLVVVVVMSLSATGLAEWLASESVSDDPAPKSLSGWNHWGIATDAEGNWHIVWIDHRDHDQVYYRKYVPGLGWESEEEKVSPYWPALEPAIAVDDEGNVHVVWWVYGGGFGEIYYRQKSVTAGWDSVITRLDNPDLDEFSPSIAVDSEGNVHVVYAKQRVLGYEIRYVMKDPVEGWQQGYIISQGDGVESSYPTICVDRDDNLHVVWIGGDTNGPDAEIYYLKYTQGVGWDSLPTRITSDDLNTVEPCVAVDGLGRVHVVWRERGDNREEVGYRGYTPGVGWDAYPTQISPEDSVFSRSPSVAADPFGRVHVVWHDYDPILNEGEVYYRRFDPASGWLEVQQLTSTAGGYAANPDIASDASGNLGVVYENSSDALVYLKRWIESGASVTGRTGGEGNDMALRPYPNPFMGLTTLRYFVGGEAPVRTRLGVFDVEGRLLRTLSDAVVLPGEHIASWDGCDYQGQRMPPGIYYVRIKVGHRSQTRTLVLLR